MPGNLQESNVAGNTYLHLAAQNGHLEAVEYLLSSGANHSMQNDEGDTPLHYATRNGHLEIVTILLKHMLNGCAVYEIKSIINCQNNEGDTPLHYATRNGHLEIVEYLINAGADVNLINRNEQFTSPLSIAIDNNNLAVVKVLVEKGANVGFTAAKGSNMVNMLHLTSDHCNTEMMKFFIEKGLDVNETDFYDDTALHTVIKSNKSEEDKLAAVRLLLANNADVNAIGDEGKTPLQVAEEKGDDADIVDILRNKTMSQEERNKKLFTAIKKRDFEAIKRAVEFFGADVNAESDYDGWKALHYAVKAYSSNMVAYLIQKGARVNDQTKYNHTPLSFAANSSWNETYQVNMVKELLSGGASVEIIDNKGNTPLHEAALFSYSTDVITELLERDPDVNAKNNDGETPLHKAAVNGKAEFIKLLVRKGARTDITDNRGRTALHLVVSSTYHHRKMIKSVRLLLKFSTTDINAQDDGGNTPLHKATGRYKNINYPRLVKSLIIHGALVNIQNNSGNTPLHCATIAESADIVKVLLNSADVNIVNIEGNTSLHIAVEKGHLEIVKLLVEKGADISIINNHGKIPLDIAKKGGNTEIVTLLEKAQQTAANPESALRVANIKQPAKHSSKCAIQ